MRVWTRGLSDCPCFNDPKACLFEKLAGTKYIVWMEPNGSGRTSEPSLVVLHGHLNHKKTFEEACRGVVVGAGYIGVVKGKLAPVGFSESLGVGVGEEDHRLVQELAELLESGAPIQEIRTAAAAF